MVRIGKYQLEGIEIMFRLSFDQQTETKYDCLECGQKNCVSVYKNRGFCDTFGCIKGELIQFVFHPSWQDPKTCLASRERWWRRAVF